MAEHVTFDAFVMVDWSAASSPGRVSGQANGIWVAVGEPGAPDSVRPFRTRAEATSWLIRTCARLADAGHRVLLGVDVCFGYPAGTARALGAPPAEMPWRWMWNQLHLQIADDDTNTNNRFAVAGALNARSEAEAGPFWGHPPNQSHDGLAATKGTYPVTARGEVVLDEHRLVERWLRARGAQPKSVWQLSGAGAVGSQTLMGIPRLRQIRSHPALADRCRVWPVETGFGLPSSEGAAVVIAEVYPSLIDPPPGAHEVHDAAQVLTLVRAYRWMAESDALSAAFTAPTLDGTDEGAAERASADVEGSGGAVEATGQAGGALDAVVAEEGWVLGVRQPPPPKTSRSQEPFDWAAAGLVEGEVDGQTDDADDGDDDPPPRGRLQDATAAPETGEDFRRVAAVRNATVMEIVSSDTPDTDLIDQTEDEWVVLLEGTAELEVDGETVELTAGDWILLPARTPHRVMATSQGARWLAVHIA